MWKRIPTQFTILSFVSFDKYLLYILVVDWSETQINEAPMIHVIDRFMLFGGFNGPSRLSRIAAFTPSTNKWTTEGHMQTPRSSHGVINFGDEYLIIGGNMDGKRKSENCSYLGDQLECTYQKPTEPRCKYKAYLNFSDTNFRSHTPVRCTVFFLQHLIY